MRRDAWQALADPTRRKIIELLSSKDQTINNIAEQFDISRPAISKQIRILAESNLLNIEDKGRERICSLSLSSLEEIYNWVRNYESFWLDKLDALEDYLAENEDSQSEE